MVPTPFYVDNTAAVAIAVNPISTSALKHVKRRHFFVRDAQDEGEIAVIHVGTARNLADMMTKVVGVPRFRELWGGIRSGFGRVSAWVLASFKQDSCGTPAAAGAAAACAQSRLHACGCACGCAAAHGGASQ